MSLTLYSRKCIKKYLEVYRLIITEKPFVVDEDGGRGRIYLYVKTESNKSVTPSRFDPNKRLPIGHIHYLLDTQERILHIDIVYLNKNQMYKPNTTIKLFRVLLMYLLANHSDYVDIVTLTAKPNDYKRTGREFCLPCVYQELGFEPVNYESKKMTKECIKRLKKNDDYCKSEEKEDMCILCKCQTYGLDFITDKSIDIRQLAVDMKVLVHKLKTLLDKEYYHIDMLSKYIKDMK